MTASKWLIAVNAGALMLVMAFVLAQLRAVLKSLVRGNPFVPSNATRLRRIAFAVLIGEFAAAAIVHAENVYAAAHVAIAGLTFDAWPSVDFTSLGSGLIILVIAEVFRAGTQLDEEQALTI